MLYEVITRKQQPKLSDFNDLAQLGPMGRRAAATQAASLYKEALDRLEAGGSTAGGQGIELAYALAEAHFQPGAANRIVV